MKKFIKYIIKIYKYKFNSNILFHLLSTANLMNYTQEMNIIAKIKKTNFQILYLTKLNSSARICIVEIYRKFPPLIEMNIPSTNSPLLYKYHPSPIPITYKNP